MSEAEARRLLIHLLEVIAMETSDGAWWLDDGYIPPETMAKLLAILVAHSTE